jgi:phosphatidylinositol alpha 1,6-mannosyltransferase
VEGLLWVYLRRFYRQCEHVYVASPSIADTLEAHGLRRGVHLWERGVDVQHFHPRRRSVEWRREQGIGDDEVVVLFVGRTVREKGLSILADVDRRLTGRGVRYHLVVVGDGPDRDALELEAPSARLLGFLRGDALARAYASADVFLFPSETETLGNVTLEAMASGLPAVCADAPGSDHLVIDGVTGFLVEPGNGEAFANRVLTLIADRALRAEMGEQARARARSSDWATALERLLHLYRRALHGDSSSRQAPQSGRR